MSSLRVQVLLLLPLVLAACLSPPAGPPSQEGDLRPPSAPLISAAQTLADLRHFSDVYPGRQYGSQTHVESRQWLAKALEEAGLEVVRQRFPVKVAGPNGAYEGENIIGIHWGQDRQDWIIVGAHYDVTGLAAGGAYDDGSGTLLTVHLAKAFARIATERTLAFILFDQEEKGLLGSAHFVQSVREGSFAHKPVLTAMIDLDMVGITHPHPAPLVCQQNSDQLHQLTERARQEADVPDAKMQYRAPRGGTSDAASFMRHQVPTLYCWSNWDEVYLKDGTRVQGSYPWWHRADTYATLLAMAGDEATLRGGFQTVLDIMGVVLASVSDRDQVIETSY